MEIDLRLVSGQRQWRNLGLLSPKLLTRIGIKGHNDPSLFIPEEIASQRLIADSTIHRSVIRQLGLAFACYHKQQLADFDDLLGTPSICISPDDFSRRGIMASQRSIMAQCDINALTVSYQPSRKLRRSAFEWPKMVLPSWNIMLPQNRTVERIAGDQTGRVRDIVVMLLIVALLGLGVRNAFNAMLLWAWSGFMALDNYLFARAMVGRENSLPHVMPHAAELMV